MNVRVRPNPKLKEGRIGGFNYNFVWRTLNKGNLPECHMDETTSISMSTRELGKLLDFMKTARFKRRSA